MRSKKLVTVLIVVAAVLLLGGFAAAQAIYIPVISKGFQHQFWQAVRLGAEKAGRDFKVVVTYEGPETEAMVDKQMDMLRTGLGKNPSAIVFAALDSKAAIPLLQQAKAKKIPIIAFDTGVDSDIPITTCATDNVAATALAADKMAALIGGSGKVGVIIHDQTSRTGIDRGTGFLNQMKKEYPKVQIIGPQYGGGDRLKSTDLAKAMIQSNPDIKGFFGANEGSLIGVLNAVRELDMVGKITVIGYDSGKQQIDAIRSGEEAGAVQQDPIGIGYTAVEAAVKVIKGQKVPKFIDTGFKWCDKTSIDNPDVAAVLYN